MKWRHQVNVLPRSKFDMFFSYLRTEC